MYRYFLVLHFTIVIIPRNQLYLAISLDYMNSFAQFLPVHPLFSAYLAHLLRGESAASSSHALNSSFRHLNPSRIFNASICTELSISQITTNPFALTYLTKAMKKAMGNKSDVSDNIIIILLMTTYPIISSAEMLNWQRSRRLLMEICVKR